MSSHVSVDALASSLAQEQKLRDDLYTSMGAAVKELVNLLLPADYLVTMMVQNAERIEGSGKVAIRRDELDSVVHLVTNAHVLASRLRAIIIAAGLSAAEAAAAPRAAEPVVARPRDDWRKDLREPLRPVKAA